MEFKGTQGEWRVVQLGGSDKRHYREGFDVAIETDETSIACMDSDNPHDATLIAAAPDLLQVCGAFLARYDNHMVAADLLFSDVADKARAAIAKALGESS